MDTILRIFVAIFGPALSSAFLVSTDLPPSHIASSVFSSNIRLAPAFIFQVAFATELLVVLENSGVFPAGTLAIIHSQNVTILTSSFTNVVRTYAFKTSTNLKLISSALICRKLKGFS